MIQEMLKNKETVVHRAYKSRLFSMVYENPEELLVLYNAINGTNYTDSSELEINTLENAIYLSMKNDVSFLIDMRLELYEHQSTFNPNLPLCDLMYVMDLYSAFVRNMNIYGTKALSIPTPHFIVFYNGKEERPEKMELKLSDLYMVKEEEPKLELKVTMYNINKGKNKQLMDACKTLKDYAEYTSRVRDYAREMEIEEAVERAITECIREGILADFLKKNRAEAKKMSIYEYDEEKQREFDRQEGREEGIKEGIKEGEAALIKLVKLMKTSEDADKVMEIIDNQELRNKMYEKYGLSNIHD